MKISNASMRLWALATALCNAVSADGSCFGDDSVFHPDNWKYCQEISENLRMYYTPMEDTIMLGLHATEGVFGWSSLAPSGNGGMKGAAQIVVRQDDSGEWTAEDRYSSDYTTPPLDDQQDVQLLFAQQDDQTGETAWGVVIPQNSCDEPYDYPIEDRSIFVLWAFGKDSHAFGYHAEDRGQFTANLMGPPPTIPDLEEYDYVDLIMPNVTVVRGEPELDPTNPFICSYFDMELLGREKGFSYEDKIHVVGYEPILSEGNEEYVHHLTIFTCQGEVNSQGGTTGIEDSELEHNLVVPACTNMPPGCSNMFIVWALGQDPPTLPNDVGIPIGENRWMVMQMHYFNPKLVPGIVDSSGVRLRYTTDLRPIDAGLMNFVGAAVTGQHPPLPGGMQDVKTETLYVESDCTRAWDGPLNVISVFHHSHFMGLSQEILVEREGKNLGPIRKEFKYDYNHQGTAAPVNALQQLLPGDRLASTCHFDTTKSDSEEVEIGEESNKEMCFQTIYYYPKQTNSSSFIYWRTERVLDYFIYDSTWCSSPPTDDSFGSLCAEKYYDNVFGFYEQRLTSFFPDGVPSFNLGTVCNGGDDFADFRDGTSACPGDGCVDTQDCSEEQLRLHAEGVCQYTCDMIGLTVYPNLERTEPYETTTFGCPQFFHDVDPWAEPETCQVKGSLPQTIELVGATDGSITDDSSGEPSCGTDCAGDRTDAQNSSGFKPASTFLALIFLISFLHV